MRGTELNARRKGSMVEIWMQSDELAGWFRLSLHEAVRLAAELTKAAAAVMLEEKLKREGIIKACTRLIKENVTDEPWEPEQCPTKQTS